MATQDQLKETQRNNYVAAMKADPTRVRVEIDEFLDDNAMTNLFLLALADMQKEDPEKRQADGNEDWWTYYSLSSIHGLPRELWNGVPNGNDQKSQDLGNGYCTHGSFVFPTWHRVYILMFEQAVVNKMREIAQMYNDHDEKLKYLIAADRFRLPYWDPFVPRNRVERDPEAKDVDEEIWGLPKILVAEAVYVKYPNKKALKAMANPLRAFYFPDDYVLQQKGREPFTWTNLDWRQGRYYTIRSPGPSGDANLFGFGESNQADDNRQGLVLKIQRQGKNLSTKLWSLLSTYDGKGKNNVRTWESFASHSAPRATRHKETVEDDQGTSVSLESWHDSIHGLVKGHMGNPAIAGFDPIFWLHHNNIDRLLAIYQALYPDNWVSNTGGMSSSSALYPFYKDSKNLWTSNDVRDWKTLGFAVPGDKDLDDKGREALKNYLNENYHWAAKQYYPPESITEKWPRDLSQSIALYGDDAKVVDHPVQQFEALSQAKLVTRTIEVAQTKSTKPIDKIKNVVFKDTSDNKKLYPKGSLLPDSDNKSMRTWNAQVRVQKFAFNGPFSVHLFIGHVKKDQPERFMTKKNEIGYSYIFASPRDAPCANCLTQREQGFVYQDAIPITTALTRYLASYTDPEGPDLSMRTLQSFEPEHVRPFLKEHLNWAITDGASALLDDPASISRSQLQVSVWDRIYDLPTADNSMGKYYPADLHSEITEEKLGGYGYTDA